MSIPKKHHFVPQFLLKHFADDRERLVVHRLDQAASYQASVLNVGQTTFGHSLFRPGRDPDHGTLEAGMGKIEGAAADVIRTLRRSRVRLLTAEQREMLGFLIALQWTRSRFTLDALRCSVLGSESDEAEYRSLGLLSIQATVLDPWQARAMGEFDPSERSCYVVDWLQHGPWTWRLYRPNAAKLVVADTLVSMWGVADGASSAMPEAWTHHGVGIGFENCARITMPLAPDLGLVIARDPRHCRGVSAYDFNRATVYNSREFVAHHPDGLATAALNDDLSADMRTQRWIFPYIGDLTFSAADREARQSSRGLRNRADLTYGEA